MPPERVLPVGRERTCSSQGSSYVAVARRSITARWAVKRSIASCTRAHVVVRNKLRARVVWI